MNLFKVFIPDFKNPEYKVEKFINGKSYLTVDEILLEAEKEEDIDPITPITIEGKITHSILEAFKALQKEKKVMMGTARILAIGPRIALAHHYYLNDLHK